MLILGKIILALVLTYEVYRIVNMNHFLRTIEIMKETKELEKGSPELLSIGHEVLDNKQYIFIVIAEILYVILTVTLLFTPYFWISIVLFIQSLISWLINKNRENKNTRYLDSLITIVVVIFGTVLVGL